MESPVRFTIERITLMLAEPPDSWTLGYRDELLRCRDILKLRMAELAQLPQTAFACMEYQQIVRTWNKIAIRTWRFHRLHHGQAWRKAVRP